MSLDPFRFVVHRAKKHETYWTVPGFSAKPTLEEAISLAVKRSSSASHPLYVHELLDNYEYVVRAVVERGKVRQRFESLS